MKKLKWSAGILAFILLSFFLLGVFQPEITYTTQVEVERPAKEAFRVYNDVSKMARWLEGFKSITLKEGLPYQPGSQYEVIMQVDGEIMKMKETITAIEPNTLFAYLMENDILWCETEVYFKEREGITEIVSINRVKGKTAIWRSVFVLSRGYFEKSANEMYAKLKEVIEGS
jgi:uncharacterized membrane protein